MYSNVVVGIDGTGAGQDAVAAARVLAPSADRLWLVHVRVLGTSALRDGAALDVATREQSIQLLTSEQTRSAPAAEILSVLAPDVGTGLHDAAESRGADLLVVGSCHRSAVGRVLAGDDTLAALHRAPCAVAVAPRGYRGHGHRPAVIGVAYDGSPHSQLALGHAQRLADATGATLRARRVVTPRVYGALGMSPAIIEDAHEIVAQQREQLGELGDATLEVTIGPTDADLVAFSEEVDVLVCGSRHNGLVKRVALGSTSDFLARHCACVLIVTPAAISGSSPSLEREPTTTA